MPELPEVETIRRTLQKALIGKKIQGVVVYTDKMAHVGAGKISNIKIGSKAASKKFVQIISGATVVSVSRRAKFLVIELSKQMPYYLVIHLRMSGQLIYRRRAILQRTLLLSLAKTAVKQTLPTKHTHIEFLLNNGDKLFYNDTRQFGHLRIATAEEFKIVMRAQALGPEPLDISPKDFESLVLAHPRKRAKDFLLNQKVIAGIGNIYADESLFISRINPLRKMGSLRRAEISALHNSIQKVLKAALRAGGSSIESFLATNGVAGKFSEEHLVYAKGGKPCPVCGKALLSQKIGSRTSTFCASCQV